ncbi:SusF/SusE family outer membrane protein [Muribaculum intestinale]|uniref:SusF/SusE family outer membrane protein n=1 Tax=Muribaculum intestinale TaxID=1796646 RepID=UPI0026E01FD3|nr:SusF/SusE family outer membrane protein [Muribaculum intestinale]
MLALAFTVMAEDVGNIHAFKAPLYWSVYERAYELDGDVWDDRNITLEEWERNFDWVAKELLPYGYDMVCTDGFLPPKCDGGQPYMTRLGQVPLKDLIAAAKSRGLRVGIYDSPLETWCDPATLIPGTNYTVGSLLYDKAIDNVKNPDAEDKWHTYIVFSHPGAKEYIDGFFKHYNDLGVEMIRIDFLSWFEDGYFRFSDTPVGKGYGRQVYADALAYICKTAQKYGIYLSLVMPHLYNDAEIESRYGNMVRIVNDTFKGGWSFTSASSKGQHWDSWPNCDNQYDGFIYWSHISGRDKVILDGDFTIMHSYKTQAEKEFAISIQLMAGGPIAVTDQYCTIGDGDVAYYTNEEMLALNKDRFVGKPMDATLMSPGSNIWHGRMTNGDHIVGFFNREDEAKYFSLDLKDIGLTGEMETRDLWRHRDEGKLSTLSATVEPHGCKIMRLAPSIEAEKLYIVGDGITWVPGGIEITKTADGVFTWEGDLPKHTVSETGRVRALNRPSWDYPVHPLTDGVMIGEQEITVTPLTNQDKYPDKNWHAAQAGNYKLVFDLNNRTLTATLLKSFIETSGLYLIGSATAGGWEVKDATPLQVDPADRYLYTWEGDLKVGELKLLADMYKGYDGLTIHPLASDSQIGKTSLVDEPFACYTGSDDTKWNVTVQGFYKLSFDLKEKTMCAELIKEAEIEWPVITPIETNELYLIGVACGWNIDNAILCTRPAPGNVFVYEGELPSGGVRATPAKAWGKHFRPKINNQEIGDSGLDCDFTYVEDPDYNWNVASPGKYRLSFNLDNWTMKAERIVSTGIVSIEDETAMPREYYNLSGVKVSSLTPGIYIEKQGSRVRKVVVK